MDLLCLDFKVVVTINLEKLTTLPLTRKRFEPTYIYKAIFRF